MVLQCQDIINIWFRLNNDWKNLKGLLLERHKIKTKNKIMYNNAKKLYDILLSIYYNNYNNITDEEKKDG